MMFSTGFETILKEIPRSISIYNIYIYIYIVVTVAVVTVCWSYECYFKLAYTREDLSTGLRAPFLYGDHRSQRGKHVFHEKPLGYCFVITSCGGEVLHVC